MRRGRNPLAAGNGDLVVDPAVLGIPEPGIAGLGRNIYAGRADGMLEILQPPRIGFTDRHA